MSRVEEDSFETLYQTLWGKGEGTRAWACCSVAFVLAAALLWILHLALSPPLPPSLLPYWPFLCARAHLRVSVRGGGYPGKVRGLGLVIERKAVGASVGEAEERPEGPS